MITVFDLVWYINDYLSVFNRKFRKEYKRLPGQAFSFGPQLAPNALWGLHKQTIKLMQDEAYFGLKLNGAETSQEPVNVFSYGSSNVHDFILL